MVKSCRARIVSFSSLGSSFVKVFVFQIVIFCYIVVRIVSVYRKLNFDMLLSLWRGRWFWLFEFVLFLQSICLVLAHFWILSPFQSALHRYLIAEFPSIVAESKLSFTSGGKKNPTPVYTFLKKMIFFSNCKNQKSKTSTILHII